MTRPGPKQSGNPRRGSEKDERRAKEIQDNRARENAKAIAEAKRKIAERRGR